MAEKYAGNGRLSGAAGKGAIIGGLTEFAGGTIGLLFANSENIGQIRNIVHVAAVVGWGIGAYIGWNQADAGIKQYQQTAQKADMLETAVTNAVHDGLISATPSLQLKRG